MTFKAGTKLGPLTHLFTLFYRQGEPKVLPSFSEKVLFGTRGHCSRRLFLSELLAQDFHPIGAVTPDRRWEAGRAGGKYVGLRDFNLIFFSSPVKRTKIQQKRYRQTSSYIGKLQLTVLYFSFPFCPCCPHRSGKLLNLSPSPNERSLPSCFSSACMPWGKKKSSIPINYRQPFVSTWCMCSALRFKARL